MGICRDNDSWYRYVSNKLRYIHIIICMAFVAVNYIFSCTFLSWSSCVGVHACTSVYMHVHAMLMLSGLIECVCNAWLCSLDREICEHNNYVSCSYVCMCGQDLGHACVARTGKTCVWACTCMFWQDNEKVCVSMQLHVWQDRENVCTYEHAHACFGRTGKKCEHAHACFGWTGKTGTYVSRSCRVCVWYRTGGMCTYMHVWAGWNTFDIINVQWNLVINLGTTRVAFRKVIAHACRNTL